MHVPTHMFYCIVILKLAGRPLCIEKKTRKRKTTPNGVKFNGSQVLYWAAQPLNIDVNAAVTVAEKSPALHDHIDAVAVALQQQSELALLKVVDAEIMVLTHCIGAGSCQEVLSAIS